MAAVLITCVQLLFLKGFTVGQRKQTLDIHRQQELILAFAGPLSVLAGCSMGSPCVYVPGRCDPVCLASSSSGGKMQLLETEFSRTIRELIDLHLLRQDSIPAFLSALTLDLFSRQTIA
ncbi:Mitotic spindle assembly checkpoint protein MAD1 [Anas platyrhynchos]|uniref:Mitotic spindle assembly checkpoint protein MAD1 n=1 Tax=Anas platyrhynchos TaxID=8839 RepID=R0L5S6_ANAPL|nr:Mitotic spindle assembly checkpoint protein MAD1 [Anas platyrhynchos]